MSDIGWKIMFTLGINQQQLQTMINSENNNFNITEEEKNQVKKYYSHWTIKYENTFGKKKFMCKLLSIIVGLFTIITATCINFS